MTGEVKTTQEEIEISSDSIANQLNDEKKKQLALLTLIGYFTSSAFLD